MTVIRPNSVSGITSITAQANEINFFRSNGLIAGLNLNGVNFNTTAGISTLAALKVTGNLDVEGVLTYQDVTNVDSVGIVTARSGINVSGTSEFTANVKFDGSTAGRDITFLRSSNTLRFQDNAVLSLGDGDDFKAFHNGTDTRLVNIGGGTLKYESDNHEFKDKDNGDVMMKLLHDGAVELYHNNVKRLETSSVGVSIPQDLDVDGHTNLDNVSIAGITTYSKSGSALRLNDGSILRLGNADADFFLYHDGNNTDYISAGASKQLRLTTDDFVIKGANNTETLMTAAKDGAVSLYHNNTLRLTTFDNNPFVGVSVTNDLILNGAGDTAIRWAVGGNAVGNFKWGIYHANADGHLRLFDNVNSRTLMVWKNTGAIELNYAASKKFETTSSGAKVSGALDVTTQISSGDITITSSQPMLFLQDNGNDPDWSVKNGNGNFFIRDETNSAVRFAINQNSNIEFYGDAVPSANNTHDLGTTSLRWRNIYTNDLNLSNEGGKNDVDGTWGNYTIQEGESDLFLINKRNGKKYKFNLTEVS